VDVRDQKGGATLRVRVKPRASRTAIEAPREGALVVRLQAPPVDGAANAALQKLLARAARVPAASVKIVGGATAREKVLQFLGLSAAELRGRLETRRT
jgi:uncharacterized protein